MRTDEWTNDYRKDPAQEDALTFFVFDDLNGSHPTLCYYDNLYEALGAYRYIGTSHPEWRAALGGELNGGALDFVQRRNGVDTLLRDAEKLESWASNPGVQMALKQLAKQLHLEDPSLDQLKQQAKDRARMERNEHSAKSPSRPKSRGELEL